MALIGKSSGGNGPAQEPLVAGNYLGRLAQVIDLGIQPQRPYNGQEKPPVHMISVTYELGTEFMKDADGNDMEDKPRWISEDFALHDLIADRAKSTLRYLAFDAKKEHGGDWSLLLGMPCTVTVAQNVSKANGKVYANVSAVTPPMKGIPVPELKNEPRLFVLDEPDMETFKAFPDWIQDRIKGNLEYNGSQLQALLGESPAAQPTEVEATPSEEADMDCPF